MTGNVLTALAWIAATAVLVLAVHAGTRALLPPRRDRASTDDEHEYPAAVRDAANAIALRAAALYGVLLALVYAQQLEDYQAARRGVIREAAALADIAGDAARYGGPAAAAIPHELRRYVGIVVGREWGVPTEERAHWQAGWDAYDGAYRAALDLVPRTAREESLRARVLQRLADVADVRHARQELAARDFGAVVWVPAVAGLVFIASTFFVFPPTREVRAMITGFGAFAGLILFLIHAFDNPFSAPLRIPRAPLQRLLQAELRAPAPPAAAAPAPTPAPGPER